MSETTTMETTTTAAATTEVVDDPWQIEEVDEDAPIDWPNDMRWTYTVEKLERLIADSKRPKAVANGKIVLQALLEQENEGLIEYYIDLIDLVSGVYGLERLMDSDEVFTPGRAEDTASEIEDTAVANPSKAPGIAFITSGLLLGGGIIAGGGYLIYKAKKDQMMMKKR